MNTRSAVRHTSRRMFYAPSAINLYIIDIIVHLPVDQ